MYTIGYQPQVRSSRYLRGLLLDDVSQLREEYIQEIKERQRAEEAPETARSEEARVGADLAGVAERDHECRGKAELECRVTAFTLRQVHHEDQLNDEERDGKEPINVPVGIVEGLARRLIHAGGLLEGISPFPAIENAPVVVAGDKHNERRNHHRNPILRRKVFLRQDEEDERRRHRRNREREHVVHQRILAWC
jgi:hypothetical protein